MKKLLTSFFTKPKFTRRRTMSNAQGMTPSDGKNRFVFKKNNDIQLNVRISENIKTSIDQIAKKEDVERTEVIRELIRVGLTEYWKDKV